jgi:multidrug resistance efflux pump
MSVASLKDVQKLPSANSTINQHQGGKGVNYRKGIWDQVAETALDTEASHSRAESSLSRFGQVDRLMDDAQEKGYNLIRIVINGAASPRIRQMLGEALNYFAQAEALESEKEGHVARGHSAVQRARSHNHSVIQVAEAQRKLAARKLSQTIIHAQGGGLEGD